MKTQAIHTPTPWKIVDTLKEGAQVTDQNNRSVIVCSAPYQQANAAFIVRAVNSHEELLDLVQELYKYCGSQLNNDACIRIEEAIAKAEELI